MRFKQTTSPWMIMAFVWWDSPGGIMINFNFIDRMKTVTGNLYAQQLKRSRETIKPNGVESYGKMCCSFQTRFVWISPRTYRCNQTERISAKDIRRVFFYTSQEKYHEMIPTNESFLLCYLNFIFLYQWLPFLCLGKYTSHPSPSITRNAKELS